MVAFAPRDRGRDQAQVAGRASGGGASVRAPAAAPSVARVRPPGRPASLPAVQLSRSAPTVLRESDLRAILAGRRSMPVSEEEPPPRREYPRRQQVVNITYTVQQVVAPSSVVPPAGPVEAEAVEKQLADTAQRICAAADGVEDSTPMYTRAELRAAAERGETVSKRQMDEADKRHALAKLLRVLPLGAISKVSHSSVEELVSMDAERLAHHFVTRGRRAMWQPGTTNDCRNVWTRFMAFLDRRDVVHDGMHFKALDVGDFLEEVDRRARAKGEANKARAEARDARDAERARREGRAPPPPRKWQNGMSAVKGVTDKLRSIRKQFGIDIPLEDAATARQSGRRPPQPAPALTIGIVFRLYARVLQVANETCAAGAYERLVSSPAGFRMVATAQVAAGLLFAAFSCNRMEQANQCAFAGEVGGFLHGVLLLDKHPNPEKRSARPFWMRLAGPDGSRAWFDFLKRTLSGVEAGCFVFRDFECAQANEADPAKAIRWLNNPLVGPRLVEAIARTIGHMCCVSYAEACRYAKHAARHFLMEVGSHRGEPSRRQVEIGRWSGSTAQDVDLTPAQRLTWRHSLASGVMPDNYAPKGKVRRVCGILGDQMVALERLWEQHVCSQFVHLPVHGDFTVVEQWMAPPAESDEGDELL